MADHRDLQPLAGHRARGAGGRGPRYNNLWIHHRRKVVIDSDNHFPPWMEIHDDTRFVPSGQRPIMMFALRRPTRRGRRRSTVTSSMSRPTACGTTTDRARAHGPCAWATGPLPSRRARSPGGLQGEAGPIISSSEIHTATSTRVRCTMTTCASRCGATELPDCVSSASKARATADCVNVRSCDQWPGIWPDARRLYARHACAKRIASMWQSGALCRLGILMCAHSGRPARPWRAHARP